jgi:hypothetical protein
MHNWNIVESNLLNTRKPKPNKNSTMNLSVHQNFSIDEKIMEGRAIFNFNLFYNISYHAGWHTKMAPDIYTPFRRSNFKLIGEFGKKKKS